MMMEAHKSEPSICFNLDCMEGMKAFPDKLFDLAVVDAVNNDLTSLRENGKIKLTGTAVSPPTLPDTLNFEGHALEQMGRRQISLAQANEIAEHAILAIRQRNGTQHSYYSDKGFIVIKQDGSIGTLGWLDEGGKQVVEVMKKHGF